MLRTRSKATLVAALLFAVLGGAQCPERKVQCITDAGCRGDEVCTDGVCASDDTGGEGEGEGEVVDLPTAITAFADGFSCTKVDDDDVGQCLATVGCIGGACRLGAVDFARDRMVSFSDGRCPANAVCEGVAVGFPGGMCGGACDDVTRGDGATCGAIAILSPFNDCLARRGLFSTCAQHARPASLRTCGFDEPCRPDYLCAKTPDGASACLPPTSSCRCAWMATCFREPPVYSTSAPRTTAAWGGDARNGSSARVSSLARARTAAATSPVSTTAPSATFLSSCARSASWRSARGRRKVWVQGRIGARPHERLRLG